MPLTPEQRKKILDEERRKVKNRIKRESSKQEQPWGWAVVIFLVMTAIGAYQVNRALNPSASSKMTPSITKSGQILKEGVEQDKEILEDFITKGKQSGLIMKIEPEYCKVYVEPTLWAAFTFEKKEKMAFLWLEYFAMKQNEYDTIWVEIYDGYSGKKIGGYNSFGFKVY